MVLFLEREIPEQVRRLYMVIVPFWKGNSGEREVDLRRLYMGRVLVLIST